MNVTIDSPYMTVRRIEPTSQRKTPVYLIGNRRHGDPLGYIRWQSRWRQFVFEAINGCVFSEDCMGAILDCVKQVKAEYAATKKGKGKP